MRTAPSLSLSPSDCPIARLPPFPLWFTNFLVPSPLVNSALWLTFLDLTRAAKEGAGGECGFGEGVGEKSREEEEEEREEGGAKGAGGGALESRAGIKRGRHCWTGATSSNLERPIRSVPSTRVGAPS